MKRLVLCLILGAATPCCAQVEAAPQAGTAAATPLARLGAVLGALPGLAAPAPALSGPQSPTALPAPVIGTLNPVPAARDLGRAAVLVERARPAMAGLAEAAVAAPASPEPAARTLEAVNATLKDFTPQQLRAMPEEKLTRLVGLVLDQASGKTEAGGVDAVAELADTNLARIESLKAAPLTEKLLNPGHTESHPDMVDVAGVPERVKAVEHEAIVFRHYTTAEGLAGILKSGGLWNGFLPYVDLVRGVHKKVFKDLTGLFLTKPGVDGQQVGVPSKEFDHYVDVKVSAKLPVLEIDKGSIFLVPLPARTQRWVADMYRKWLGGADPGAYRDMVQGLDARGGPGPDLVVPVQIVDYGKVGEKSRLTQLLESAQRSTAKAVATLLKKKSSGVKATNVLANTDTKTITEYSGVPARVERLDTNGRLFRHWIKDEETLKMIVRTGLLRAGPTPYVEFTGGRGAFIKDIYPDLHGVFFTIPARSAAEPRVMNWEVPHYVDFEVPEGVSALRLDGDDVLMIPAAPGTEIPVKIVGSSLSS
ncbi:MAG: hypothetical protein NTX64_03885 [Elusimicrobia bacterium]|nr:hypothetical protein [Elusimicrobiota bacterium]